MNIQFEEECWKCSACGFDYSQPGPDYPVCKTCDGHCYKLTDLGEEVVKMLSRRYVMTPRPPEITR